jgi:hypothetical protein
MEIGEPPVFTYFVESYCHVDIQYIKALLHKTFLFVEMEHVPNKPSKPLPSSV